MTFVPDWLVTTVGDGFSDFWAALSSSFVTTIATIFFGSFVALRAFYIQKRHERMADQYEKALNVLASLSIATKEGAIRTPIMTTHQEREFLNLMSSVHVYFGPEAKAVLQKFSNSAKLSFKMPQGDEKIRAAREAILDCYDELTKAAQKDLRPGIAQFAKEFFKVFVRG